MEESRVWIPPRVGAEEFSSNLDNRRAIGMGYAAAAPQGRLLSFSTSHGFRPPLADFTRGYSPSSRWDEKSNLTLRADRLWQHRWLHLTASKTTA